MKVSFLHGTFKTHKGDVELSTVFDDIKNGVYTSTIFDCRTTRVKLGIAAYKKKKVNLPCFTPSGRFGQCWGTDKKTGEKIPVPPRKVALIEYNGNVILDYDRIIKDVDLLALVQAVNDCKYTLGSFISPSNKGCKVVVKTSNRDPDQHYDLYQAVSKYYNDLTGFAAKSDKSSSNINRLCYMSSDCLAYYEKDCTAFEFQAKLFKEEKEAQQEPISFEAVSSENTIEYVVKAMNRVEKKGLHYVEGQRREYIMQFSIECVKYGVLEDECKSFVEGNLLSVDCDEKMVFKLVEDMYQTVKPSEHGMYKRWAEQNRFSNDKKTSNKSKEKAFKPDLHQEEKANERTVSIPQLSDDEIKDLNKDVKSAIWYQKSLESALREYYDFRKNLLTDSVEYRNKGDVDFIVLNKSEYNQISRDLIFYGIKCGASKIESTIDSGFSRKVHPVKEKFESWGRYLGNDKKDYIAELAALVKTDAPKGLFESIFKKWLVASVANVFVEGYCTNHHCLILCGGQETNKTTFFTSLFSSEYVLTGHLNFRDKDTTIMLADTFLVVLDEQFSVLDKDKDWETLKSMITVPRVKARWHYAKTSKLAPRIANFCGTTNRIEILQDDTGNRRFIPFQVLKVIDINKLKKMDMRKVWGQAYQLYKEGWFYLPTAKEKGQINSYQQSFKKMNNEHYLIMDMYQPATSKSQNVEYWSSTEIWKSLTKDYSLSKDVTVSKIGRAMSFLGFVQKTVVRATDKKRGRYWLVERV